ncbi:Riboflavin kinase [Pseudobythopirellula maris]|uniref:Riboflavin biosynthesis protein n=1 Tax=Pseudobythopirellula maris TaxID=2527991 RepID=A0A5C5ZUJ3_9BACT|nr:Riboflavin kinase [Pseudobythopirellula maris]
MQIVRHLAELPESLRGGALTIGNFDGVHRGHAELIARLVDKAKEVGGPALVLTFDPHPVRLLRPAECPPPLTWTERKAELLADLGVDCVIAYPTDKALLCLSAEEFFRRIVVEAIGAKAMIEGPNFYFGHNREGDVQLLADLAAGAGMSLDVVQPVALDTGGGAEWISSSRIRRLLLTGGKVGLARRMLTSPYKLRGMITHGAGRGAELGFPTANLEGIDTLLPAPGVYAAAGWVMGRAWPAAVNIGSNPTFGETHPKVEAHLVGLHEPLYGKLIEVDFLERLRDVRPFPSAGALVAQIRQDAASAKNIADAYLDTIGALQAGAGDNKPQD